jgi:hypothetical protein
MADVREAAMAKRRSCEVCVAKKEDMGFLLAYREMVMKIHG